jgi:putative nucleotidyltransferase with HDIG domain
MRQPLGFAVYYALVVAGAVLLMAWGVRHPGTPHIPLMAAAFLVIAFGELRPVPLPSGGYATPSAVVELPALVIVGPVWTAAIDLACTLVVQGAVHRKPVLKMVFNAASNIVTYFAAVAVFRLAGGHVGDLAFPRDALPVLACGVAYFLVNSWLVATVLGLAEGPGPWRVWQRNFLHSLLHHLSFVALGALVTVTYLGIGLWGIALCAVPFVVAAHAFRVYLEIRADLKDFVRALSEVLEEVDPYTRHHSVRVSQYAVRLARGLGQAEREVEEIEYAALVHDIGKIGPQHQHILQKPGALSQEEQRTLRAHPGAGADIVAKVRALRRASEIVRSHHERPDGLGYPFGLRSGDVPLGARILNVADAFDAMTSDRPYRRALSLDAAVGELRRGAGTQFDTDVVACLVALHQRGGFPLLPSPSSEDLLQLRLQPARRVHA